MQFLPRKDRFEELHRRRPEDLGADDARRSRVAFEDQHPLAGARQQIREDRASNSRTDDQKIYSHGLILSAVLAADFSHALAMNKGVTTKDAKNTKKMHATVSITSTPPI